MSKEGSPVPKLNAQARVFVPKAKSAAPAAPITEDTKPHVVLYGLY